MDTEKDHRSPRLNHKAGLVRVTLEQGRKIQLEQVLFDEESDQFTVKVAKTKDAIKELLEAGFEYVYEKDELVYFRKRK